MPTTVISKIGNTNTPITMDYSTLASWEAALPANLVTADEIREGAIYDQGELTSGTNVLTIDGITTDATRYIVLRCATAAETGGQGASFRDKTAVRSTALFYNASNGVAIRTSGNYYSAISSNTNYTRFNGLQIACDGAGNDSAVIVEINADNCQFRDILAKGARKGMTAETAANGGNNNFYNCCVVMSSGNPGIYLGRTGSQGGSAFGCTVVKTGGAAGTAFTVNNYNTATIKNCAGFGFSNFVTGSATATGDSTNNATDAATAYGTSNQVSKTYANQFVSTTNDFRALSTSDLKNNGVSDTTNTPNDISVTVRSLTTPTIGAWEVSAPGLNEEGFIFRNDDGSESAATSNGTQDTNVTAVSATNLRLRFIIDASGDIASKNFRLEYREKNQDSLWKIMEVK